MWQFWNITSGIYAKYHEQVMLLFVYTTTHKRFVIFTCGYFKLSGNTTALSQSNCRNLSGSSIIIIISVIYYQKYVILTCNIHRSRVAPRDCSQLHAKSKSTKPQPLPLPPTPAPPAKKKKILHHHSLWEKNHRGSPERFSTHLPGGIRISL